MVANPINDRLNTLYSLIRIGFWPLLILGPVAFILLLPTVRVRRRRALDTRYRLRMDAYAEFKKHPADSKEKWSAFLCFMAITFDAGDKAWTRGDSELALRKIGADKSDLDELSRMHTAADAKTSADKAHRPGSRTSTALPSASSNSPPRARFASCSLPCCYRSPPRPTCGAMPNNFSLKRKKPPLVARWLAALSGLRP